MVFPWWKSQSAACELAQLLWGQDSPSRSINDGAHRKVAKRNESELHATLGGGVGRLGEGGIQDTACGCCCIAMQVYHIIYK